MISDKSSCLGSRVVSAVVSSELSRVVKSSAGSAASSSSQRIVSCDDDSSGSGDNDAIAVNEAGIGATKGPTTHL